MIRASESPRRSPSETTKTTSAPPRAGLTVEREGGSHRELGLVRPAVLALQGSVEPHLQRLEALGFAATSVRRPQQLAAVTHLILPGGESTTIHLLLTRFGLWDAIADRARAGSLAIFGTCAGAILMGRASDERPPRWGLLDIDVRRNAYGRQVDSFECELELAPPIGPVRGVFIRAPQMADPGPRVQILGELDGSPVLVRQDRLLAATFHPELTDSLRVHEYFLGL
ncbi:MAG: pyridoxal 5'-phosphate synthase glutaminase subunit PdxT [Planctomycetota bacterium]